jgi:hypothetical protein
MRNKWTGNIFGEAFVDEDDEDQDSLKEALLETSPYLLALTILISLLHSVFELLAFKNGMYRRGIREMPLLHSFIHIIWHS